MCREFFFIIFAKTRLSIEKQLNLGNYDYEEGFKKDIINIED